MRFPIIAFFLLAAALVAPSAPGAALSSSPTSLTLEIRHLWNGQVVSLPQTSLPLPDGQQIDLTRLAYLISNPVFGKLNADGVPQWLRRDKWQAYVDATDGLARISVDGLPREKYAALQFQVGLDEETNASDPNQYGAGHPLNPANNLHWSWQGGYIFLAAEGRLHRSSGPPAIGFSYHLGNGHNLMNVSLPLEIDLTKIDHATVILDFHIDRIFNGRHPVDILAQTSSHGRQGDPHAERLSENIERAFQVRQTRYRAAPRKTKPRPPALSSKEQFVGTPRPFVIPKGFPIPALPTDYPLTEERVALGKALFNDPLLSRDGSVSCSSCHQPNHGLTDGLQFSVGVDGKEGTRNSMPLANLAWKSSFFWDGRSPSLREQALVPIEDPVEMHDSLDNVTKKIAKSKSYPVLFAKAFGDENITAERLGIAIEQFLLTLTSFDSKFDRAMRGEGKLTEEETRGFELFFTEYEPRRQLYGADCFHCHGGAFFTDHGFHNNGLALAEDFGLEKVTGVEIDRGKFSTPTLRNVALTAPYMHDGRFETLEEVLDHYTDGIKDSPTLAPNLAKHPGSGGIPLSEEDKAAIVAFLKTLSDEQFTQTAATP
ncbi:MAG: MbnP family protein [Verrucomicrobiota bacterium]